MWQYYKNLWAKQSPWCPSKIATSIRYPRFWIWPLLCLTIFNGCSTVGDTLFGRAKAPEESKNESELEQALTSLPASKYEWAVQAFETGQYESALEKFLSLEREGAAQPGFELIPYYIGMCHYQMQQWDGAITNLKKFISINQKSSLTGNARVSLLLALEKKQAWTEIATLSSDLLEHNPAKADSVFLQLIWAEALVQQNEYSGAESLLEKAEISMQSIPFVGYDFDLNPEAEDLHGRYGWMRSKTASAACLENYVLPEGKKGKKKKDKKEPSADNILDGQSECLEKSLNQSLDSFALYAPRWTQAIADTWTQTLETYYQKNLQGPLKMKLKPAMQRSFYRIAALLQSKSAADKLPVHVKGQLERLEKLTESLLMKLSLLSSPHE